MRPNYVNLCVGYLEEQIFNQFDGPKPELFGRYIDDCLGATSCTKNHWNDLSILLSLSIRPISRRRETYQTRIHLTRQRRKNIFFPN